MASIFHSLLKVIVKSMLPEILLTQKPLRGWGKAKHTSVLLKIPSGLFGLLLSISPSDVAIAYNVSLNHFDKIA